MTKKVTSINDLRVWDFDGSSTNQSPGHDSDIYLRPAAIFKDPFRGGDNILVMCDAYLPPAADGSTKELVPIPTNTRAACAAACAAAESEEPWFGIEQEYTLLNTQTKWPLGWPSAGYPGPQGPYYCSKGLPNALAAGQIAETDYPPGEQGLLRRKKLRCLRCSMKLQAPSPLA